MVYGASLVSVVYRSGLCGMWPLWYTEVAFVVCGLLVYRGAVCGIPEVPRVVDARRRRSSRDTRAMCGWGSGVHTRPKFEIGDVELLARKRELSSAPGTTNTRPLGGQTETPEFGGPLRSRTSRFIISLAVTNITFKVARRESNPGPMDIRSELIIKFTARPNFFARSIVSSAL